MTEFYEFHDSTIEGIEHDEGKLILKMRAYKHVWPDGFDVNSGTGWVQLIEITIDDPHIEEEFVNFPIEISGGSLVADRIQANPEDIVDNEIPGSLSGAVDIEVCITGWNDDAGECRDMKIRGKSAAITSKGEAKYVEKLPWWGKKDQGESKRKLVGAGQFDSGVTDLATNKKHMNGYGK